MAVRAQYADVVKDEQGRPIAGASIAVYQVGTTTAITETIYADASGTDTLTNPLTADSSGRFQFYLAQPKRVDLYVSKTGYTAYTLEDVDVSRTDFLTVVKTANQTVNDSAVLVDDEHLAFTVGIGEVWAFRLFIRFTSGTTPDIKFSWSVPAGANVRWAASIGVATAMLGEADTSAQDGAGATIQVCEFSGWIRASTTAGTVNLTWAQNTADASDTTVAADSHLILHRLS